jgi:hypothetical protein
MNLHINKKKRCTKLAESENITDQECDRLSLIRVKDRDMEESKFKCKYCEKIYCNNYVLNNHIKKYCKKKEEEPIENSNESNDSNEESSPKPLNEETRAQEDTPSNVLNNVVTNTVTNTINNLNIVLPNIEYHSEAQKEWIINYVHTYVKQILATDPKYTDILKKYNLNVIIDKSNIGLPQEIYKNFKDLSIDADLDLDNDKSYKNDKTNPIKEGY